MCKKTSNRMNDAKNINPSSRLIGLSFILLSNVGPSVLAARKIALGKDRVRVEALVGKAPLIQLLPLAGGVSLRDSQLSAPACGSWGVSAADTFRSPPSRPAPLLRSDNALEPCSGPRSRRQSPMISAAA